MQACMGFKPKSFAIPVHWFKSRTSLNFLLKQCSLRRRSFSYSLLYTQFIYMIFIYSQSFEVFSFTLSVSLFLIFLLFFGFLNLTFQVEMESISQRMTSYQLKDKWKESYLNDLLPFLPGYSTLQPVEAAPFLATPANKLRTKLNSTFVENVKAIYSNNHQATLRRGQHIKAYCLQHSYKNYTDS